MRVDPIKFMVALVRSVPGLPATIPVSGELDMHSPGARQIDVELEGGARVVRDRMDAWTFSLNHYGATKGQCLDSALLVREYLLEHAPGVVLSGVALDSVEEEQAPFDNSDEDSREQRIIHRVTIYIYEA